MDPDFSFAFNSSNFSDRILRLEISAAVPPEPAEDGCATVADWVRRRRRRLSGRRGDLVFEKVAALLEYDEPDTLDVVESKDHEGEAVAMIEESPSGEPHVQIGESLLDLDYTPVVRVNSIFISSAILAAKSPFFYKLFSNGMQESDQRHATIRINASEEAAFMELLGFMYSGKLSQTSPVMLLDVLMAADKFQVSSCMVYCSQMLRNLDMTTESALLFLELPSNVSMPSTVQPLADAAKEFFAEKYKDLSKFQDEVMNLSLAGIEAILSRDDLQVASEDSVYDFVLKWARAQYPNIEERRKILWPLIRRVIRFPYMSCRKLRKLLACNELDYLNTSGVVLGALFYKCEKPHLKRDNDFEEWANRRFTERAYRYRPVKVVEFEIPYKQCIVYLNLTREECKNLFPSGRIYSQAFNLDGQGFFLSSHCNVDQQNNVNSFGLFLGMQEKGSVSLTVDYEFAARTSPTCEFLSKHSGKYNFTGGKAVGYRNLFSTPWTSFIAEDSIYFINGVLHLRAELTIKESEQQLQQPPVLVEL